MKSNADLQKDVYEELKWDSRINEGDIGVSVNNGIVTLSGSIPNFPEKWAAEEATKSVAGVTAVVNKIEVKLAGSSARTDEDIAQAALNALKWDVWVPKEGIQLMVEKGWISLSGQVHHAYQSKAAENAIRHLAGVRGFSNGILVTPPTKPKDVQFQIKRALHRHAEEDANNIHVEVAGSEVVLTGKVHSLDEKNAAEWAALRTEGVSNVKNNVTILYR